MSVTAAQVKELRERTGAGMMDCRKALEATAGNIDAAAEKLRMDGTAKADKKASRTAADGTIAVAEDAGAVVLVELNCETDFVAKDAGFQALAKAAAELALKHKQADVAALGALGSPSLDEQRRALVAKIGENITLRRVQIVPKGAANATYVHGGSKIVSTVALEKGDAELAKDVAMHVAAAAPKYLAATDVPADLLAAERKIIEAQVAEQSAGKPAEIVAKMVDGKLRKFTGEITLLGQPFVKDDSQSVEKVVKARGGAIARFVRMQVGEGIEKQVSDFASEVMAQAGLSGKA